ncbi:TPA: hypothetical protein UL920_004201 [Stenotrophomonas maltophilia]|nr:hypothetical protein [Stenotrophomonas maltophilia]HEL4860672.1 hypothetical protein [Stenotrophomonas maltophilia]HEL7632468.1 hypothetical protein [Stenotrophomonas maltophilia]HEL7636191.1 hypothetical protein [Stenotrophomonas maltophilia]
MEKKATSQVFGVTAKVLPDSYVERVSLDQEVSKLLAQNAVHLAVRGPSKSGKSWLRRKVMGDPIVVQCVFETTLVDIYTQALSKLDVKLTVESVGKESLKGTVKASSGIGAKLIAYLSGEVSLESGSAAETKYKEVGRDIGDLAFVAGLINASGRRLVIEDYHYLAGPVRKSLSGHLKALWDLECNVVIIGVWTSDSYLTTLNPDLEDRLAEIPAEWTPTELGEILEKGGKALNVEFLPPLLELIVENSFENAGLLQTLTRKILDRLGIEQAQDALLTLDDPELLNVAAAEHAKELEGRFQAFARSVSTGMRTRKESTGIYAHAMDVILQADDDKLRTGISLKEIYDAASAKQPRIKHGNLRRILEKIDHLQVDDEGRGLVITYNSATERVTVVDRRLLLYRRFAKPTWPWAELISNLGDDDEAYQGGDDAA